MARASDGTATAALARRDTGGCRVQRAASSGRTRAELLTHASAADRSDLPRRGAARHAHRVQTRRASAHDRVGWRYLVLAALGTALAIQCNQRSVPGRVEEPRQRG